MTFPLTQAALTAEIRTLLARWITDVFDAKQREGLHGNIRMLGSLETALTPFCAQIEAAGQALEKEIEAIRGRWLGWGNDRSAFLSQVQNRLGTQKSDAKTWQDALNDRIDYYLKAEARLDCAQGACPSDPPCARHQIAELTRENDVAADEIAVLSNSLERAEYDLRRIRCSYCGATYPQETEGRPDGLLAGHIAVCEKHPLRKALVRAEQAEAALAEKDARIQALTEDVSRLSGAVNGIITIENVPGSTHAALTADAYQRGRASILALVRKLMESNGIHSPLMWLARPGDQADLKRCGWCDARWEGEPRNAFDHPANGCLYALAHAQPTPGEPT